MMNFHTSRSFTYACRKCDKTFTNNSDLKLHEKWHQFKFECSVAGCNERFGKFQDLQRHETTHNVALGEEQLEILEDAFRVTSVPTDEQYKELVFATGLQEDNIKNWFNAKKESDNKVTIKQEPFIKKEIVEQDYLTEFSNSEYTADKVTMNNLSEEAFEGDNDGDGELGFSDNTIPVETMNKANRYDLMKTNYENLQAEIEQLKQKYDLEDSDDEGETDFLPVGWKYERLKSQFVSPEGIILQSHEQALKFMQLSSNKYTQEDINKVASFHDKLVHPSSEEQISFPTKPVLLNNLSIEKQGDALVKPVAHPSDSHFNLIEKNSLSNKIELEKQNSAKSQPVKNNSHLKVTSSIDLTDVDSDVVTTEDNGVVCDSIKDINKSEQFTIDQLEILNDAFDVAPDPTDEQYDELVFGTGLDESKLKEWFTERRNANVLPESRSESKGEINAEQLEILEDAFKVSPELTDDQYDELVFATGLEESVIKDWFDTKKKFELELNEAVNILTNKETIAIEEKNIIPNLETKVYTSKENIVNGEIESAICKQESDNILEEEQIEILEDAYKVAPIPTDEQFDELVVATGLDKVFLMKWFQDKNYSVQAPQMTNHNINLRNSCLNDGWVEDEEILPAGWLIKKHELSGKIEEWKYLTPDDRSFNSTTEMLSYLKKPIGSEERFSSIYSKAKNSLEMLKKSWIKDASIPSGWFIKYSKDGKNTFMAPDQRRLLSRRIAVDYMVRNGHSQEDIRLMQSHLGEEGWIEDSSICPEGWRVKKYEEKKGTKYNFLSPTNEHFKSAQIVLDYMLKNKENFVDLDIKKIKSVMCLIQKDGKTRMFLEESKTEQNHQGNRYDKNLASNNVGQLPTGWKSKQVGARPMFVSPMGEIFKTIDEVIEEMTRIGTYSHLDFEALIGVSLDPKEQSVNETSFNQVTKRPQPDNNVSEHLTKKLRKNSTFTQEQILVLERLFLQSEKPSSKTIENLVGQFGIKRESILKWFAKKRSSNGLNVSRAEISVAQFDHKPEATINPMQDSLTEINSQHLEILEDAYKVTPVLNERQLDELAFATRLHKIKIGEWFSKQNEKNLEDKNKDLNRLGGIQEDQLEILEDAYIVAQFPTDEQFDELVFATGLDEAVIKNWFSKKRQPVDANLPPTLNSNIENPQFTPSDKEDPLKSILPEQLEILEDAFKVAAFPSDEQFDELVFATDLEEQVVQKWFLNQQSKQKEENSRQDNVETRNTNIKKHDSSNPSGGGEKNSRKRKVSEIKESKPKESSKTNKIEESNKKLTAEQLEILEDAFKVAPIPTSDQFDELVFATEVDEDTIKQWFENKSKMTNQEKFNSKRPQEKIKKPAKKSRC